MNHIAKLNLPSLLLGFILSLLVQPVSSQELPKDELGTFIFDLDVDRLANCELATSLGENSLSSLFDIDGMFPGFETSDVSRIYGTFEFSEPWDSIQLINPDNQEFPLDFVIRIVFTNEEAMGIAEEETKGGSRVIEENGKKYYGPPESDSDPSNLRIGFENKTMEIGTTKYLYRPNAIELTEAIDKAWNELPDKAIVKFAIDVEASRPLINGIKEEFAGAGGGGMGPSLMVNTIMDTTLKFTDDTDIASGYLDLDREKMLSLTMVGKNEEANEKIAGVLNGLLFMGALPLKNIIKTIPFEEKEHNKVLLKLADQLSAEANEDQAVIQIKKPEGFDQLAKTVYYPKLKTYLANYQSRNDLMMVGLAAINFSYNNSGSMPFVVDEGSVYNQDLSWRVLVMSTAYGTGLTELATKVDTTESWDHETNMKHAQRMPRQYGKGKENSNVVWVKTKVEKLEDVTDRKDQTIMILRLPEPTENNWMKPGDSISMIKVIQMVSKLPDGQGILAVTYQGNVITLDNSWDHNRIKSYLTPNGGDNDQGNMGDIEELNEFEEMDDIENLELRNDG
jgi:hypothetical protein